MANPLAGTLQRIDAWIDEFRQSHGLAGVAIAATDRSRLQFHREYGHANLESRTALRPDHLFQFGSIGKSFTSIAILQLVEAGALSLDDLVTSHLPWFAVQSTFEPIRIKHLLSHTSGLIRGGEGSPSGISQIEALRETETGFPPGSNFHYSNDGYKILGLIAAKCSGLEYGELIRASILEPLGMASTEPTIVHSIYPRVATGYQPLFDDRPYHSGDPLIPSPWFEGDTGDGSLVSSAADLAIHARMLLNRGRGDENRVLSDEMFSRLTTPAIAAPDAFPDSLYGLGVRIARVNGNLCVYHGGGMPGYHSALMSDLDAGLGVVVL